MTIYVFVCLFVSKIIQILPVRFSCKKREDASYSNLDPIIFFKSDPDHGLDTKIIKDSDFSIYLSLGHLKNSHMLWRRYSLSECSSIKIEVSLLICLLPFAVLQYFEH